MENNNDINLNVKDEYKHLTLEELKDISNMDRLNFSILFLNVEKNLNISNLIRSAHLLGAKKVIIVGSTRYDRRGTVGMHNYIDVERIECSSEKDSMINLLTTIKKENNYQMLFLEQNDTSIDISSDEFKKLVIHENNCIVIGNESVGIDKDILDSVADNIIEIDQFGVGRSLNAAVAGSIVMFKIKEIMRNIE